MSGKEKIYYASAKPSPEILALFKLAKDLDASGLGNAEILERGGRYLVANKKTIDFTKISKKRFLNYNGTMPSSFKVRINDLSLYEKTRKVIQDAYEINRVMTPFLLRVILSAYIFSLENTVSATDTAENVSERAKIDALRITAISLIIHANKEQIERAITGLEEGSHE